MSLTFWLETLQLRSKELDWRAPKSPLLTGTLTFPSSSSQMALLAAFLCLVKWPGWRTGADVLLVYEVSEGVSDDKWI